MVGCSIAGCSISNATAGFSMLGCSISNATAGVSVGLGFYTSSNCLTSSTFSTGTATSSVFERFTGSAQ